MKRHLKSLTLIISLLSLIIASWLQTSGTVATPEASPGHYRVIQVFDGDTVAVAQSNQSQTVRLIGIDTPETHDPRKPVQCFGQAATDYLAGLIGIHPVRLEADPATDNQDKYQRLLRYVYLPDGTQVNRRIIEDGYAFAYTVFPHSQLEEFRLAEQRARQSGAGLWSACQIDETTPVKQTNPK